MLGVTDQTDLFTTMTQAMGLEGAPAAAGKVKASTAPKTASDNASLIFVGAGLLGGAGFAVGRRPASRR